MENVDENLQQKKKLHDHTREFLQLKISSLTRRIFSMKNLIHKLKSDIDN